MQAGTKYSEYTNCSSDRRGGMVSCVDGPTEIPGYWPFACITLPGVARVTHPVRFPLHCERSPLPSLSAPHKILKSLETVHERLAAALRYSAWRTACR